VCYWHQNYWDTVLGTMPKSLCGVLPPDTVCLDGLVSDLSKQTPRNKSDSVATNRTRRYGKDVAVCLFESTASNIVLVQLRNLRKWRLKLYLHTRKSVRSSTNCEFTICVYGCSFHSASPRRRADDIVVTQRKTIPYILQCSVVNRQHNTLATPPSCNGVHAMLHGISSYDFHAINVRISLGWRMSYAKHDAAMPSEA
jgi:hypothetical protein